MIKGLGNDIIEISRIKLAIFRQGKRFLDKVFTPDEQKYCLQYHESERHFAGRFAAKEAAIKALGKIPEKCSWLDFEILNDAEGKPVMHLSSHLRQVFDQPTIMVSISHCKTFATAVAIYI